jgi:hypothetical protein
MRLDPHSLPVRFDAPDGRADSGIRTIEINRERVVVRRAVSGIAMAVNVRIGDFLGIACRMTEDGRALVLAHRDPSLSVPLLVTDDESELARAWSAWSDIFVLPRIDSENSFAGEPSQRRRRRNAIRARRPKFLMRRKPGRALAEPMVHRDEREMIART